MLAGLRLDVDETSLGEKKVRLLFIHRFLLLGRAFFKKFKCLLSLQSAEDSALMLIILLTMLCIFLSTEGKAQQDFETNILRLKIEKK